MNEFQKKAILTQLLASGASADTISYIMRGHISPPFNQSPRFGEKIGYLMNSLFGNKQGEVRKRYRGKPPLPRVTGANVGGLLGHYLDPDKIGGPQ